MRKCPYCGSQMSDEDTFCLRCGAMADKMPAPEQPSQQQVYTQTYSAPSGRPRKNNLLPVILVTVGILAVAIIGVNIISSMLDNGGSSSDTSTEYTWDFYYSDTDHKSYTYKITIPDDYYSKVQKSTIDRGGSTSDVHLKTSDGEVYAVSEYIVVDDYIKKVVTDLKKMFDADKSSFPANTDFASFLTAFVQGTVTYTSDDTVSSSGEYWKYPIETLCSKKGDCEDTAILLAALFDAAGYSGGIFLLPEHAMAAIKATEVQDTRVGGTVRFEYYPVETTVDSNKEWPIGKISDKYYGDYFHLYTGSVSTYYGVTFS